MSSPTLNIKRSKAQTLRDIEAESGKKFKYTKTGDLRPTISNATLIYKFHPDWAKGIGFDDFSQRLCKTRVLPSSEPGEWTDYDCTRAQLWLDENFNFHLSEVATQRVIEVIAQDNKFNPVKQYLTSLQWDGQHRIHNWLTTYLGVEDSEVSTIFGKCMLIAGVACILEEDGIKNDTMIVIEGEQGIGKSTALQTLFSEKWFTDTPIQFGHQNGYLTMIGKWGAEWAEMAKTGASTEQIRSFLSQTSDEFRRPYARNTTVIVRRTILCATTNASHYLNDPTGNRRFMPVKATKINIPELKKNRDQLWAEAVTEFRNGERWWFDNNNPQIIAAQKARFDSDPWQDKIERFVANSEKIHTDQIYSQLTLNVGKLKKADHQRIKEIMTMLGWESGRPYIGGIQKRGFTKAGTSLEIGF